MTYFSLSAANLEAKKRDPRLRGEATGLGDRMDLGSSP